MSKYIKLDDAIDAVMNTEAVFADVTAEPYQKTRDVTQALHNLPTIEVSEDCISREDLRRSLARPLEINNADEMYWKGWHDCTVAVETRITDSPRAVPSRAEGEWKLTINDDYRCTACGLITSSYKANYCPNCGAKMKGAEK